MRRKPHSRPTLLHRLKMLGPGLITGASDDDPSGIATYSVAGATTGLSMLWLSLLTTPMMAVVQGMCARIAMVSGRGLAENIRRSIPVPLAYVIGAAVVAANTFNAGADFAGMAAGAHLVIPAIPAFAWVVLFGALLLMTIFFFSYRTISSSIKWLTVSLFAYAVTAFVVRPHWGDVLRNLVVPNMRFQRDWVMTMVAVLGTTISPYLFFWQASLEVEEEKSMGRVTVAQRRGASEAEIGDAHFDVNAGMIFSNLVMAFIIITTALTLHAHGIKNIATAEDAARALQPFAGKYASLLFTLGIVGTGLLAIPALAGSSAYVVTEMLPSRSEGLNAPPARAPRFYFVLGTGIAGGMIMCFAGVDPIRTLYYSAVINGVVSIPLLYLILRLASDARLMGKWGSSVLAKVWAWIALCLMTAAAAAMFVL